MLSPEIVDHVARLARLELTDAERDKMAVELSKILDHIEAIQTLDLEGVEPTSHVVHLENVLRADVPWTSMPPEVALANAPEPFEGAFRVPSPQHDAD